MFAVRNATLRDGHHSFVARFMALTIGFRRANCGGLGEDDPQSLALVCMEPAGRGTVGSGKLAADDLVACEQRRAVDTGGVRNAAMATRCPRPWACSARRLGRLGRWLIRASPPASASDLRRSLKIASSAAALGLRHRVSKPARSCTRVWALRGASQGDEVGRIIDEPHGPAKVIGAAVVCKVPISDRTEARGRQFS
jgi:hypothetical protein